MNFSTKQEYAQVLLLLFYFIATTQASSIEIKCTYGFRAWSDRSIGIIYECECTESINAIERNSNVSYISGKHTRHENRFNVEGIRIIGASYMPKGIQRFFPNLIGIRVEQHLKEITQSDLKPFPKLEHISLERNRLEMIEKDLFKFNPKLKYISLKHNFIQRIDSNVFDHLGKLTVLELGHNECISDDADDRDAVLELIKQVQIKCVTGELSSTASPSIASPSVQEIFVLQYVTMILLTIVVILVVITMLIVINKQYQNSGSEPSITYIGERKLGETIK